MKESSVRGQQWLRGLGFLRGLADEDTRKCVPLMTNLVVALHGNLPFNMFKSLSWRAVPSPLAVEILTARQKKAEELKRLTDLASQMAEMQLAELRAEIKVSSVKLQQNAEVELWSRCVWFASVVGCSDHIYPHPFTFLDTIYIPPSHGIGHHVYPVPFHGIGTQTTEGWRNNHYP